MFSLVFAVVGLNVLLQIHFVEASCFHCLSNFSWCSAGLKLLIGEDEFQLASKTLRTVVTCEAVEKALMSLDAIAGTIARFLVQNSWDLGRDRVNNERRLVIGELGRIENWGQLACWRPSMIGMPVIR